MNMVHVFLWPIWEVFACLKVTVIFYGFYLDIL